MPSLNGTILDATALIDFRWLNEWEWLQLHYSPLFIAQDVLDSDRLEALTREAAEQYLTSLTLDTEEMFASFLELGQNIPLLSIADRSTIAIARHRLLMCASDDGLVVKTCKKYQIAYIRTLRLLSEMVTTQYKTVADVITMADALIQERGKYIAPGILANWKKNLSQSGTN
ncbi:hypothetical protein [Coleofasciculus sp. E1-EBD-02]|jgi:hypothetical protein|uniref:hypothetical protein n=1 Tax=Coleofasciculus sp. E1-EBD-02 TaxID=3068481 RepID=UPI0032F9286B